MIFLVRLLTFFSFSILSFSGLAIYLESMVYEMQPQDFFMSIMVFNDSEKLNLYSVNVLQIDKPGPDGQIINNVYDGEFLYAPLKFTLEPNGMKYFKFYYRGPSDTKERYYRITFHEVPFSLISNTLLKKSGNYLPSIVVDTVLVVRPRKVDLNYTIDEGKGVIVNTGNTFFKVIAHKTCNPVDDDSTTRYLLPKETWISDKLKEKSQKIIVALNQYIPVGYSCSRIGN